MGKISFQSLLQTLGATQRSKATSALCELVKASGSEAGAVAIFHQKALGFRKRNNVRPCGVWGELGRTGVGRAGVGCFGGDSLVPAMVAQ